MKFFAIPNLIVTDSTNGKFLLKFDENGEYETEDNRLILRLKNRFKFEESKPKEVKQIECNSTKGIQRSNGTNRRSAG